MVLAMDEQTVKLVHCGRGKVGARQEIVHFLYCLVSSLLKLLIFLNLMALPLLTSFHICCREFEGLWRVTTQVPRPKRYLSASASPSKEIQSLKKKEELLLRLKAMTRDEEEEDEEEAKEEEVQEQNFLLFAACVSVPLVGGATVATLLPNSYSHL